MHNIKMQCTQISRTINWYYESIWTKIYVRKYINIKTERNAKALILFYLQELKT